jgi:hypothetical protein
MFDMIQNETVAVNWLYLHNSIGVLRNETMEGWDGQASGIAKGNGQGGPLGMVHEFREYFQSSCHSGTIGRGSRGY